MLRARYLGNSTSGSSNTALAAAKPAISPELPIQRSFYACHLSGKVEALVIAQVEVLIQSCGEFR